MECNIVDVGARYGIFPAFEPISAACRYIMFEPDEGEASRLKKKYSNRENVTVHPIALFSSDGHKELNIYRHHGLNSFFLPDTQVVENTKHYREEMTVVDKVGVNTRTLDNVVRDAHMLKIDTEGSELEILKGAKGNLEHSVSMVRAEINFSRIRKNGVLFADIDSFLREYGFELLNFDYRGCGTAQHTFADPDGYGRLIGTDGVWFKPRETVWTMSGSEGLIRTAIFLMVNKAADVALDCLLWGLETKDLNLESYNGDPIVMTLDKLVQMHFKKLQGYPYFELNQMNGVYRALFKKDLKLRHTYYESM